MSTQLASFFTKIGFQVDKSGLTDFDKSLTSIEKKLKSLHSSLAALNGASVKVGVSGLGGTSTPTNNLSRRRARDSLNNSYSRLQLRQENASQSAAERATRLLQQREADNLSRRRARDSLNNSYSRLQLRQENASQSAAERATRLLQQREADNLSRRRARDSLQQRADRSSLTELNRANSLLDQGRRDVAYRRTTRSVLERQTNDLNYRQTRADLEQASLLRRIQYNNSVRDRANSQTNLQRSRNAGGGGSSGGARAGIGSNGIYASVRGAAAPLIGAYGATKAAQQSYDVANFTMSRMPQFEFITGSKEKAAEQITYMNKEATRLGVTYQDVNQQYKQLLASTIKPLGIEGSQNLYSSSQDIFTMLGMSNDAQNRAFKAMGQMASKDGIYAEELRQQLAEASPGIVQIFADALSGGDTKLLFENMKKAKYHAEDLLKVAEEMKKKARPDLIAQMLNTPEKKLNRLKNAWTDMWQTTNNAGATALMNVALDKMFNIVEAINEKLKEWFPNVDATNNALEKTKDLLLGIAEIVALFWVAGRIVAFTGMLATMRNMVTVGTPMMVMFARIRFLLEKIRTWFRTAFNIGKIGVFVFLLWIIEVIETFRGKETLVTRLTESLSNLIDTLKGGEGGFGKAVGYILQFLGGIIQFLGGLIMSVLGTVWETFRALFGDGSWDEVWTAMKAGFYAAWEGLKEAISWEDWGDNAVKYLKEALMSMKDWMVDWFATVWENVKIAFNPLEWNKQSKVAENWKRFNERHSGGGGAAPQLGAFTPDMLRTDYKPPTQQINATFTINGATEPLEVERIVSNTLGKFQTQSASNYVMMR